MTRIEGPGKLTRRMARKLRVQYPRGKLGWGMPDLAGHPKGDARKVRLAERLRRETTMTLAWIGDRLYMGAPGHVSSCCIGKRATKGKLRMRTVKISGSDLATCRAVPAN